MIFPDAAGLRRTVPARFALRVLLAVLASTPVVRAQCVVGVNGGLQFGPGTWAHAPASGVLDGLGDFTIETFVKTTAPTGYLVDRFRCCNGTTTDDAFSLSVVNGKPNIELAAASGAYASVSATQAVNDGTWRHVAVVRSGATTTFYVDGAAAGSFMFAPTLGATGGKTAFGVSQTPSGTPSGASFNG
ncbi:MAG TPA: LamG-like jellyroll fold domain-containing protein, partial [Planctomycetota bacterium]|nr:LamG-like jellyroll fold domain-containing protein [Planctomycetota bacterium]